MMFECKRTGCRRCPYPRDEHSPAAVRQRTVFLKNCFEARFWSIPTGTRQLFSASTAVRRTSSRYFWRSRRACCRSEARFSIWVLLFYDRFPTVFRLSCGWFGSKHVDEQTRTLERSYGQPAPWAARFVFKMIDLAFKVMSLYSNWWMPGTSTDDVSQELFWRTSSDWFPWVARSGCQRRRGRWVFNGRILISYWRILISYRKCWLLW